MLTPPMLEALTMLANGIPRETWRCNSQSNGWIGGKTAAGLVRRGFAEFVPVRPLNLFSCERQVMITDAGRQYLLHNQQFR